MLSSMWNGISGWFGAAGDGRPGRSTIRWATKTVPHGLANYHFLACGTTGSGKSSLIRVLMRSILPDVMHKELDTRAFIYDPKSEVYQDLAALGLHGEESTALLNPFDARCTAWDMGRDITNEAQAQELAALMVPTVEGANKYFHDAARLMLKMAAYALIRLRPPEPGKPGKWTLRDLLLACANADDLKQLLDKAGLSKLVAIDDFLSDEREARSVRMTLTVDNSAYSIIAAAWEQARKQDRIFSVHDWVDGRGPQILVVGASKQARTALATVNRLLIQRVQQLTLDYALKTDKTGRRTWVFLDEFPSLGAIPHLEEFLTEGRSRGVCVVLGLQHISHVRRWYGELANAVLGQCLHQAYFRANDHEMADWCARHFGLLLTMEGEQEEPLHIKKQSPAATVNTFLYLEPATEKTGFQCILRSSESVLPGGPVKVQVPPSPELAPLDPGRAESSLCYVPWDQLPKLEPWSETERLELGLRKNQVDAPAVLLPELPPGTWICGQ